MMLVGLAGWFLASLALQKGVWSRDVAVFRPEQAQEYSCCRALIDCGGVVVEDTQAVEQPPRLGVMGILRIIAVVFLTATLGERAWWIMPPIVFIGFIVVALVDRRRPLTVRWVLLFAAVAVALGVVLKLTE